MRHSRFAVGVLLAVLSSATVSLAQESTFKFQPGEWQVSSDVTLPDGHTTHTSLSVCANSSKALSERPHPGERCDAPVVTAIPGGVRVRMACHGGQGEVSFTTNSEVVETFAADGMSFSEAGTSTTMTTVSGKAPIKSTETLQSRGKNIGACSKSK